MTRQGTIPAEQIAQIRSLAAEGKTYRELAKMFGVSKSAIGRVVKSDRSLVRAREGTDTVLSPTIDANGTRGRHPVGLKNKTVTENDVVREYGECKNFTEVSRRLGVDRKYVSRIIKEIGEPALARAAARALEKSATKGNDRGLALRNKAREKRVGNLLKITDYGASLYGKASRQIARMEKQVEDWESRLEQIDAAKNPDAWSEAIKVINSVRAQIIYQENELRKRLTVKDQRETDTYAAKLHDEESLNKDEQQYFLVGMKSAIEEIQLNRTAEQIRDGLLLKFGQLLEEVLGARASGADVIFGGEDATMNGDRSE